MLTDMVFPGGHGVRVEPLRTREGHVQIEAVTSGRSGRCPQCQRQSRHVHSHYLSFVGRYCTKDRESA